MALKRGKGLASDILARMNSKGAAPEPAPESDDTDEDGDPKETGELAAAEEFLSAVNGGDARAVKSALEALIETCYPQLKG